MRPASSFRGSGPSPPCSPGAFLHSKTELPCYLIKLSEQPICAVYTAPSPSLTRFSNPWECSTKTGEGEEAAVSWEPQRPAWAAPQARREELPWGSWDSCSGAGVTGQGQGQELKGARAGGMDAIRRDFLEEATPQLGLEA